MYAAGGTSTYYFSLFPHVLSGTFLKLCADSAQSQIMGGKPQDLYREPHSEIFLSYLISGYFCSLYNYFLSNYPKVQVVDSLHGGIEERVRCCCFELPAMIE